MEKQVRQITGLGKIKRFAAAMMFAVVCFAIVVTSVSCDFFNKAEEDNRGNVIKPNIVKTGQDYDNKTVKSSRAEVTIDASLFKVKGQSVAPVGLTQKLEITKKHNAKRLLTKGKAVSAHADVIIEDLYKRIRKSLADENEPYDPSADPLIEYMDGNSSVNFLLGADGVNGVYNFKADYVKDGNSKNGIFFGIDDKTIKSLSDRSAEFSLYDILASGGMLDFKNAAEWVAKDNASKYFSTEADKFIYNLEVDEKKITHDLVEKIEILAEKITGETISKETFDEVMEIAGGWIKVNPTKVDALVSANGLPDKTTTDLSVDVNISLSELDDVLFKLLGKEEKDKISSALRTAVAVFSLRGTGGEDNTIGMRFKIDKTETFKYGEKDCNFGEENEVMFSDMTVPVESRKVLTEEEIRSFIEKIKSDEE